MKNIFLVLLVFIFACTRGPDNGSDDVIARVYDEDLYKSELDGIVPPGTSIRDSLLITKNFINNWIRQNLIVYQAEKNLTDEQKDFSKQLETYRNSLIIYQYESNLIKQKLDTVVTDEEIEDYYEKNKNNFELKDDIVKINFVKLNIDSPFVDKIKNFLISDIAEDKDSLAIYCDMAAEEYFLDNETWVLFNNLTKNIPIKTYNQEIFLKNNRFIEITDTPYLYLINFIDFKIKESISPLSIEKENIRSIILNKRKMELIKNMENEIFNYALKNNKFEIY